MFNHNPQEGWRTTDGRWDSQNPSPPADLRRIAGEVALVIPPPYDVAVITATVTVAAPITAVERARRSEITDFLARLGQSCHVSAVEGRTAALTMEQQYRADMATWRATRPPRVPRKEAAVVTYETPLIVCETPAWAVGL